MSTNEFIPYYGEQNQGDNGIRGYQGGSGIPGYQGVQFQDGDGFFSNMYNNALLPLIKYFGKRALSTGVEIASDTLGGESFMDSLKNRANSTARTIASDAGKRAMKFAQTGKGRKRKKSVQFGKGKKRRKNQFGKGKKRKRIQFGKGKKKKRKNNQIGKGKKRKRTIQRGKGRKRRNLKINPKLVSSIFN